MHVVPTHVLQFRCVWFGPPFSGPAFSATPSVVQMFSGTLKMTDMKMTDQIAGHENAGHEIAWHEIERNDKYLFIVLSTKPSNFSIIVENLMYYLQ